MSWVITGSQKNKGLLDEFTGAAAAYSLRNLTILNDAPVVRVRRSSDNAESDFRASEVSGGALASWVGGSNNGFVRTWYDQSGNGRHAQQATTANQPSIVSNGSLITDTSKPALSFSSQFLRTSAFGGWDNDTTLCVFKATTQGRFVLDGDSINQLSLWTTNTAGSLRYLADNTALVHANLYSINTRALFTGVSLRSASSVVAVNGDSRTGDIGTGKRNGLTIGAPGSQATGSAHVGTMQELIIYPSDQSANRSAIEANINAHYAIY